MRRSENENGGVNEAVVGGSCGADIADEEEDNSIIHGAARERERES